VDRKEELERRLDEMLTRATTSESQSEIIQRQLNETETTVKQLNNYNLQVTTTSSSYR